MDYNKLTNNSRPLSLQFAQQMYDIANSETKELLECVFPWFQLEADLNDLGELYGNDQCTEMEISMVKYVKYYRFHEPKTVEDKQKISKELYEQLNKIDDDEIILLYIVFTDRMDYERLNGFRVLKKRI